MKPFLRTLLALCGLTLFVTVAMLLRAASAPVAHRELDSAPLTDLAPRPSRTPVLETSPRRNDQAAASPQRRKLARARWVAPERMPDPAHPPAWTRALATPSPPEPPDPFQEPPLIVDPNRGREHAVLHVD